MDVVDAVREVGDNSINEVDFKIGEGTSIDDGSDDGAKVDKYDPISATAEAEEVRLLLQQKGIENYRIPKEEAHIKSTTDNYFRIACFKLHSSINGHLYYLPWT